MEGMQYCGMLCPAVAEKTRSEGCEVKLLEHIDSMGLGIVVYVSSRLPWPCKTPSQSGHILRLDKVAKNSNKKIYCI